MHSNSSSSELSEPSDHASVTPPYESFVFLTQTHLRLPSDDAHECLRNEGRNESLSSLIIFGIWVLRGCLHFTFSEVHKFWIGWLLVGSISEFHIVINDCPGHQTPSTSWSASWKCAGFCEREKCVHIRTWNQTFVWHQVFLILCKYIILIYYLRLYNSGPVNWVWTFCKVENIL